MFVAACRDPDAGQVICVLDALDECVESHQRILAHRLAEFCRGNESSVNFRVLITSRPDSGLQGAFARGSKSDTNIIHLSGENEQEVAAIAQEINFVIDEEMKRFKLTREQNLVHDGVDRVLREEINKVDSRTYLWVSLVFPELQENADLEKSEPLQIVNTLPSDVDKAYKRILSQSKDIERARKLLAIIMGAKRPLTLMQLKIAASIDSSGKYEMLENIPLEKPSKSATPEIGPLEASFRLSIRQLCGLIVRVKESTVYLIHQTAQSYLLRTHNDIQGTADEWKHSFNDADVNSVLARSYIWYLLKDPRLDEPWVKQRNGQWCTSGPRKRFTSRHPFVVYASLNWMAHFNASEAKEADAISLAATQLCSTNTSRFRPWYKIYWRFLDRNSPRTYTDFLVAVSFDLVQVIHIFLRQGENIDQSDADGDTALHYAAIYNHKRAALVLIDAGALVNAKAKDGNTLLSSAAAQGSEAILKLLLSHGAKVNVRNNEGKNSLHRAVQRGHAGVVEILVNAGARINALDSDIRSPLHLAALAGKGFTTTRRPSLNRFKETIEVLARVGANPALLDRAGCTTMRTVERNREFRSFVMQVALQKEVSWLWYQLGMEAQITPHLVETLLFPSQHWSWKGESRTARFMATTREGLEDVANEIGINTILLLVGLLVA